MFRFLFFIIVFYIIYQGFKIFLRAFNRGKKSTSFGNRSKTNQNSRNIEEAEFTEIESKIHTRDENKVDGEG